MKKLLKSKLNLMCFSLTQPPAGHLQSFRQGRARVWRLCFSLWSDDQRAGYDDSAIF